MNSPQVGSYGFSITVTANVDVTGAAEVHVVVRKPDGTGYDRSLNLGADVLDASKGRVAFKFTQATDLDQTGAYQLSVYGVWADKRLVSRVGQFAVLPNPEVTL